MRTEQHIHTNLIIKLTYLKETFSFFFKKKRSQGNLIQMSVIIPNHSVVNSVIPNWFPTFQREKDFPCQWIRWFQSSCDQGKS